MGAFAKRALALVLLVAAAGLQRTRAAPRPLDPRLCFVGTTSTVHGPLDVAFQRHGELPATLAFHQVLPQGCTAHSPLASLTAGTYTITFWRSFNQGQPLLTLVNVSFEDPGDRGATLWHDWTSGAHFTTSDGGRVLPDINMAYVRVVNFLEAASPPAVGYHRNHNCHRCNASLVALAEAYTASPYIQVSSDFPEEVRGAGEPLATTTPQLPLSIWARPPSHSRGPAPPCCLC
jgi:hypothetical protein